MWAHHWNCTKILRLVKELVHKVTVLWGDRRKQRPMNEPYSLLKRLKWRIHRIIIYLLAMQSSMTAFQNCIKISEVSCPPCELKAFLSIAGTNSLKKQRYSVAPE